MSFLWRAINSVMMECKTREKLIEAYQHNPRWLESFSEEAQMVWLGLEMWILTGEMQDRDLEIKFCYGKRNEEGIPVVGHRCTWVWCKENFLKSHDREMLIFEEVESIKKTLRYVEQNCLQVVLSSAVIDMQS